MDKCKIEINTRARQLIDAKFIPVLELGCGQSKRDLTAIGVDILRYSDVDIIGDIFDVLRDLEDESVGNIYSSHFFEHISDFEGLIDECSRILKKRGELEIIVPHFSNPYFYSDPTHVRSFGLYSMCYVANEELFRRKVPKYAKATKFQITDIKLKFMTTKKYSFRSIVFKLATQIFNSNRYLQELYEEIFSNYLSCYEIKIIMRKD